MASIKHANTVVGADNPAYENSADEWNADHTTPLTTKGDLLTRDATVLQRLGVGSNTQVLTADSTQATGLKWATPASASGGTPAVVLGTAAAAGVATTFLRDDDTIVAFDATAPVTQAYSDVAATGSAAVAARRDHKHGMPASAAGAVTQIDQKILAVDTATIDFPSIPATYRDLRLIFRGRTDGATRTVKIRFNNDSGSNYDSDVNSRGGNAQVTAGTSATWAEIAAGTDTANFSGGVSCDIQNYVTTSFFKNATVQMSRPDGPYAEFGMVHWRSTAVINQITLLFTDTTKFKAGTVATLYGVGT